MSGEQSKNPVIVPSGNEKVQEVTVPDRGIYTIVTDNRGAVTEVYRKMVWKDGTGYYYNNVTAQYPEIKNSPRTVDGVTNLIRANRGPELPSDVWADTAQGIANDVGAAATAVTDYAKSLLPANLCVSTLPPFFSLEGCVAEISNLALRLGSWFLWAGGVVFNMTLAYSLNMGQFLETMPIVNTGWVVFRDVANMTFIFILLAIAIGTILRIESYNVKKLLAQVLITALLLNFSLLFAKVVIDTSNILAFQFYKQITAGDPIQTGNTPADFYRNVVDTADGGLSAAIVRSLGITSIYSPAGTDGDILSDIKASAVQGSNLIIIGVGGFILTMCVAFIFFAATIFFVVRTVALIFLMILSPLAFLARALPQTKKHFSTWSSMLISQSFFAPAFLILMWIVFATIGGQYTGVDGEAMNFASFLTGGKNAVGTIYTFMILIALILGSLGVAKSFGAWGGSMATNFAGKMTFGALGAAGRYTLGKGFQAWSKSDSIQEMKNANYQGKNPYMHLRAATQRSFAGFVENRGKGTFDLRNTGAGKAASGSKFIGSLGTVGGVGGYQKIKDDDKARQENLQKMGILKGKKAELEKALQSGDEAGVRTALQKFSDSEYAELDKDILTNPTIIASSRPSQIKAITDEKSTKLSADQKKKVTEESEKDFRKGEKDIRGFMHEAEKDPAKAAALQTALYGMSDNEFAKLSPDIVSHGMVIRYARPSQIKAVTDDKNDRLGKTQKDQISATRIKPLQDALAKGKPDEVKKALDELSAKEKANLPTNLLNNAQVFRHFDSSVREEIKKGDLAPAQIAAMNEARDRALIESVRVKKDADLAKSVMKSLSGKDLAAVHRTTGGSDGSTSLLREDAVIDHLTVPQLRELADAGLDADTKKKIGERIRSQKALHGAFHEVKEASIHATTGKIIKEGNLYNAFS